MKKKIVVGALAFTLLAGTGTGVYAYNQKVLAAEAAEQIRIETLGNAEKAVESLYSNNRSMLAEDLETKIQKAEVAVGKVQEEKAKYQLSQEISEVKDIAEVQQEVYSTLENGIVGESVTSKQIEEITNKLSHIKDLNEPIFANLSEYLSKAKTQLVAINVASEKVNNAEKNMNRETYNSALSLVGEIENDVKKTELNKRLDIVNKKLNELEKAKLAVEKEVVKKETVSQKESRQESAITSSTTGSNATTNKANKTESSNTPKSSSKSNSSSSSNSGSNNKSNSSSSSNNGTNNKSNSTSSSNSGSNNKSTPSKSTNNSSSSKGSSKPVQMEDVKKTGEGDIKDSDRTYEEGTFTIPNEYWNNK